LGLLYPTEAFMVYGYTTSTEITFVVVTDEADTKDAELKALFVKLHDLYIDVVSNPFYVGNSPIRSSQFDSKLGTLLAP
jgi:trafficking protein particle complex subunit 2